MAGLTAVDAFTRFYPTEMFPWREVSPTQLHRFLPLERGSVRGRGMVIWEPSWSCSRSRCGVGNGQGWLTCRPFPTSLSKAVIESNGEGN